MDQVYETLEYMPRREGCVNCDHKPRVIVVEVVQLLIRRLHYRFDIVRETIAVVLKPAVNRGYN